MALISGSFRVMDKHNFSVRGYAMDSVQRMHRYSANKPNTSWVTRSTLNQYWR